jgi:hypothetical protein
MAQGIKRKNPILAAGFREVNMGGERVVQVDPEFANSLTNVRQLEAGPPAPAPGAPPSPGPPAPAPGAPPSPGPPAPAPGAPPSPGPPAPAPGAPRGGRRRSTIRKRKTRKGRKIRRSKSRRRRV